MNKPAPAKPAPTPAALRRARQAWNLLHTDAPRSLLLADEALAAAQAGGHALAEGWAHLARGFNRLYFATPAEASAELRAARAAFERAGDRAGALLAEAVIARAMWREGRFREAVAHVLPLRDEGLRLLKAEQRGVLLNTIAGCYSAQGESAQSFAYMYEALRDAGPKRGHGYDTVLHCNLSHELMQIGDYDEALRHVDAGMARMAEQHHSRLLAVLLINRVTCLTELDRSAEALPDIETILALPADASGRGPASVHHETLAIAALRAGDVALGARLVPLAHQTLRRPLPDEAVELAVASALLAAAQGRIAEALAQLDGVHGLAGIDGIEGLSLRARCRYFVTLCELHEQRGDAPAALAALRQWRRLHLAQAQLASRARYQAAALQTELLTLQHRLDANDAKRRATERARADLAQSNAALSRKVDEVQALEQALREQATHDPLTGLFNRRHLNDTLPAMFALAQRDRQPLAVAILDMDHFKSVNDRLGHDAGDKLLVAFSQLMAGSGRRSDLACRYGGEEFCLLMPRTDAQAAQRRVSTLLRRWRAEAQALLPEAGMSASFSAGVSDTLLAPDSPEALLKSADQQLLRAKGEGRNRVLVAAL